MEGLNFSDLQGNDINQFVKSYRDALKNEYAATVNQIEQQRRNDQASIMSNANRSGMMYSNFPERDKTKYEAETYLPNRKNAFTTYQTGIDKLRANAVNAYNNIKSLQDAIADLNSSNRGGGGNGSGGDINYWGEVRDQNGTTWFYDNSGNPVRFSTWAAKNGVSTNSALMNEAKKVLNASEYNRLKAISDAQAANNRKFKRNAGSNYTENTYDFLSADDNAFLGSLGLGF